MTRPDPNDDIRLCDCCGCSLEDHEGDVCDECLREQEEDEEDDGD